MLKVIVSKNYIFHKSKVDGLLDLLKIYQGFDLAPEERHKVTFLIAEDNQRGVYGGAALYPQKISLFPHHSPSNTRGEPLEKMFSDFQPLGQEYWIAKICLRIGQDTSTSVFERLKLCQIFYQKLYKALTKFGEKNEIELLTFTLRVADTQIDNTLNIITYKNWPKHLKVRALEASDGYFYGILSLEGNKLKTRKKKRTSLDSHRFHTSSGKRPNFLFQNSSIEEGSMK